MASFPNPSKFAIGYAHILNTVLDFLDSDPVAVVLLAVPVLMAYLVVVTLAFAVRVAVDGYAHVVAFGGDGTLVQATALSPAAVLGWLANMVVKLAVSLVLFSALVFALFYFISMPCSLGQTEL